MLCENTRRGTRKTRRYAGAIVVLLACIAIMGFGTPASADSLSWNPVTTYNDGTAIETGKTVTYTAYWTTDPTLAGGLNVIPPAGTGATSVSFDPDGAGMPRGTSIYFTAKTTVEGVDSVLAAPLSWTVPKRTPAAPINLRLN